MLLGPTSFIANTSLEIMIYVLLLSAAKQSSAPKCQRCLKCSNLGIYYFYLNFPREMNALTICNQYHDSFSFYIYIYMH